LKYYNPPRERGLSNFKIKKNMNTEELNLDEVIFAPESPDIILNKQCKNCGTILPIENFSKAARNKDGLKKNCKKCDKHLNNEYYKNNRDKKIKQAKDWQLKNKDKYIDYQVNYRTKVE
jgi:hypothetical protein